MLTLGRVSHQVVVARRNRHLARTAQRPLPPAVGAAFGAGIYPETPQPVEPPRLPAAAVPRRQHGLPSSVGARGGAQWSVRGVFFGCTSPRRAPPLQTTSCPRQLRHLRRLGGHEALHRDDVAVPEGRRPRRPRLRLPVYVHAAEPLPVSPPPFEVVHE